MTIMTVKTGIMGFQPRRMTWVCLREFSMIAPRPNTWLDALHAYVPGKSKAGGDCPVVKLSSNENPLGPSPRAVAAMAAAAGDAHRYPDPTARLLRGALADLHGLDPDRIVCGTGSDELLTLVAQAYAAPGDEVLYVRHGFMVYPIAARRCGALPVEAPDTNYTADVDAILAQVTGKTRVVYLANPNNPTGTVILRDAVRRLHAGLPSSVVLVLDAAYAEYIDHPDYDSGLDLAKTAPNVLHTRTFSKIYGLASERIGWATGPRAIIDTLNKIRAPFNVCTTGQAGAVAALSDTAWVAQAKAHNDHWRTRLTQAFSALGLNPVPSAANFILVHVPEGLGVSAAQANAYLEEHGVLVRYLPNQGLPDCLRISIGTEAENTRMLEVLSACLKL